MTRLNACALLWNHTLYGHDNMRSTFGNLPKFEIAIGQRDVAPSQIFLTLVYA